VTTPMQKVLDDLKSGKLNFQNIPFTSPLSGFLRPVNLCKHEGLPPVPFDKEMAETMSSAEVRQRWPRKSMHCIKCHQTVVMYASQEHMIAGDW